LLGLYHTMQFFVSILCLHLDVGINYTNHYGFG
jgi:hypothetical protein